SPLQQSMFPEPFIPGAPDYQPHPLWLYLNPPPGLFESAPAPRLRTPGGGFTHFTVETVNSGLSASDCFFDERPEADASRFGVLVETPGADHFEDGGFGDA